MDATRHSELKPTLLNVIKRDGLAATGTLLVVVGFVFVPMIVFNEPRQAYFGLLIPLVGSTLICWRVMAIRGVFSKGEEVVATVASCVVGQFGENIPTSVTKFAYRFHGEKYEVQTYLFSKKRYWGAAFKAGDEVVLVVDSKNPKRVFPRDLFV